MMFILFIFHFYQLLSVDILYQIWQVNFDFTSYADSVMDCMRWCDIKDASLVEVLYTATKL